MTTFARKTGARVIAEGIETPAELACLREIGVDYGQGDHLGRPAPHDAVHEAVGARLGRPLPIVGR